MTRPIHLLLVIGLLLQVGCSTDPDGPVKVGGAGAHIGSTTAALAAATAANVYSAHRDSGRDWTEYRDALLKKNTSRLRANSASRVDCSQLPAAVFCRQVPAANADFSNVPAWSDGDIKAQFRATRDARFMHADGNPDFPRRTSWLYPDDGCFARAEIVSSMTGDAGKVKPYKLFSFGNLGVVTDNSQYGIVLWWFHVVPVVKSATSGKVYVLDAAIEPSHPLEWQDWLLKQVPSLSDVQVTVADSNAYYPDGPVTGNANQRVLAVDQMQGFYLGWEWDRQVALLRDPTRVLGDQPPWGPPKYYFTGSAADVIVSSCETCLGADALSARCATDCP
jgi:hypothetical protein